MKNNKFSFVADEHDSDLNKDTDLTIIGQSKGSVSSRKGKSSSEHNAKLDKKREEKKKQKKGDSPLEKREVVMNGAKLKCPYAQAPGELKVTSNEINLQDQLWATEGDGNNMINLQFKGTCGHTNFAGQTPPPCMSVIKLSPWQNLGTSFVQEQRVLVKESFITCNPTPNVAVTKPIVKVASIKIEAKGTNKLIKTAYWVNKNKEKTNCLLYKEKSVFVCVEFNQPATGKQLEVNFMEYNSATTNTDIKKKNYKVSSSGLKHYCEIEFTLDDYILHDEDDIGKYVFEIKMDDEEYYDTNQILKVHAVIYIPEIMKKLGWQYAFKSQEDWFLEKKNNYPWESEPKIDDFYMGWALGFDRIKAFYEKNKNKWKEKKSLDSLVNEIKKMVKDGYSTMPTPKNKVTPFGLSSISNGTLVNHIIKPDELGNKDTNVKVPLFDKYYFTSSVYEEDTDNPLDDFFGSIANCNLRFTAKGILSYKSSNVIEVTITEIGIYFRDGFDYVGSQPLGFWSLKQKNVSKSLFSNGEYRLINNASYRDYRKDSGMGEDFYRYSNMYIVKPNFKFIYDKTKK